MIDSTSLGARSSSRATATLRDQPPQSSTRANSQWSPVETAIVVRSWPIATATSPPDVSLSSRRSLERAQQGECLEVDPDDLQAGASARLQVAIDDLTVGDDEEDALPRGAVLALALVEDDVVEHGLVERDRKNLLGAEADRVLELLLVPDSVDLEDAHADPVVRDAEPNAALRKLVELEEALERVAQRIRVADLARDDEAGLERLTERVDQLGRAVVDDVCGCDLGGADLEADELLGALLLPLLPSALSARLRLLRAAASESARLIVDELVLRREDRQGRIGVIRPCLLDGKLFGRVDVFNLACTRRDGR